MCGITSVRVVQGERGGTFTLTGFTRYVGENKNIKNRMNYCVLGDLDQLSSCRHHCWEMVRFVLSTWIGAYHISKSLYGWDCMCFGGNSES